MSIICYSDVVLIQTFFKCSNLLNYMCNILDFYTRDELQNYDLNSLLYFCRSFILLLLTPLKFQYPKTGISSSSFVRSP